MQENTSAWDEMQCISALAQLERLQEQLEDLRMTIQRVVQPLSTPPRNKLKLFSGYKAAVIGSQDNMKAFRTHFESQEIQDILEHSKESLNTNPDLSASARVPRYGWKEKEIASLKAGRRKKVTAPVLPDATVVFDKEEIARAVDGWRKSNPLMSVETKDDNRDILVQFLADATRYKFHITISREANGGDKVEVECLAAGKLSTAISRCIASRPRANDLRYLLDMIAAYKTLRATTCAKCKKRYDAKETQLPTARRSRVITKEDGSTETVWEALHEVCLD